MAAVLGLQSLAAVGVTATAWAVASHTGETGLVTAIMLSGALPLALRTPPIVECERNLRFGPVAWVDLSDTALLFGVGAVVAALGGGVVGVAVIALLRTLLGTALLYLLVPRSMVWPSLRLRDAGSVLRFGAKFQATAAVSLCRDQGLNFLVAGLFGISMLGLWSLAFRVMQVPFILFQAVWRVSYPAMAHLRRLGEDTGGIVPTVAGRAAFLTAAFMPTLSTLAFYGIPAVLGDEWSEARWVVPWAATGLLVSGPISVAAAGWLYARDRAGGVLAAVTLNSLVWVATGVPFVYVFGVGGLGFGWMLGSLVEASLFVSYVRKLGEPLTVAVLGPAVACGLGAGLVGLAFGEMSGAGIEGALLGSIAGAVVFTALALRLCRPEIERYRAAWSGRGGRQPTSGGRRAA